MRDCPVCGASNAPTEDFCHNCGSYLGWSDEAPRPGRGATVSDGPNPLDALDAPGDLAEPGGGAPPSAGAEAEAARGGAVEPPGTARTAPRT
ncbi:zinc ribbon domain-containing protein, partial [Streptomyces sp. NPDC004285]